MLLESDSSQLVFFEILITLMFRISQSYKLAAHYSREQKA